jgi:phenylpropionate dioxygenase-like ring-hydroxylating dioxygenase large terminal subunit
MATIINDMDLSQRANELNVEGEARVYRSFRHFWHPVIYSHELTDLPKQVFLCGEQLVAVRLNGEAAVFADLCAHRGTSLSLGTVENDELRCAYHGWKYNHEGRCTFVPQKPELSAHLNARVKKYQAVERYGMVWVCLVDNPRFPLPDFPEFDDPEADFMHVCIPTTDWDCSAPRRTENYVDLSHFGTLHDGVLGSSEELAVPPHKAWRDPDREGALRMEIDADRDRVDVERKWCIFLPLTVTVRGGNRVDGRQHVCLFHPTPIGPAKTRNFTILCRNFGKEAWPEEALAFADVVYEQDRPVVESQRPEALPEDLSDELHVKNVDTYSVNYRRWLLDLAKELEEKQLQTA